VRTPHHNIREIAALTKAQAIREVNKALAEARQNHFSINCARSK
jgi:ribosomal protein L18E